MKIKLGIDLGTTFSAAAYVNPKIGRAEVIKNIDDNNAGLLPSVALFLSEEKVLTGNVALNDATIYPDKVVQFAKRYIGDAFFPRPVDVPEFINPVTFSAIILRSVKNYV
jgi:molecular chaperone DnaK